MVTNEVANIEVYQVAEAISKTELFGKLTLADKDHIFSSQTYIVKNYTKKQIIHMQSEVCKTLDIVIRGEVAVQKIDENGNVLTVSVFSPFDILGANLIFAAENKYPLTVSANSDVVIIQVSKDEVFSLCKHNHDFLKALLQTVSDKTILLTSTIDKISLQTIRQRIIRYLQVQRSIQGTEIIKLTMTKKLLAEKFGIPRSSLGRELQKMRSDGLITYDSISITIMNLLVKGID